MATAMLIGGITSAVGSVFSGIQQNYQNRQQANAMEESADRTQIEATAAANRIRARSRRTTASQRARFAAGGGELTGTAVDVQYDTASQYEIDAATQIYQGNSRAANLRTQANVSRMSGRNALITSGFQAGGQILGGYGDYKAAQNNPTFGTNSFAPQMDTFANAGLTFGAM